MSNKQRKILWPVLLAVLVFVAALVFAAARPRRLPESNEMRAEATEVNPAPVPSPMPRALDPVQNVVFTLYDAGIYPRELQVEKGLVSIAIEDRTGKSEGLVIQREVGSARVAIGQVTRYENHWRGRGQFLLTPGRYAVFDSSRPANRAEIVVAP